MSKDAFWFKHESNASRDLKMMQLKHIHGFWGLGLYWTVIELLREQENYCFKSDESNLQLACTLVGCSDYTKFYTWFTDCVRIGLLNVEYAYFFSTDLRTKMVFWETRKSNGNRGGRPKNKENNLTHNLNETKPITKTKPNHKPKRNHNIIEDNIKEINKERVLFEDFRKLYPGVKRGLDTEFTNFTKKHKDWKEVLAVLVDILSGQIKNKKDLAAAGRFVPEWPHLSTWINQRRWEEVLTDNKPDPNKPRDYVTELNLPRN